MHVYTVECRPKPAGVTECHKHDTWEIVLNYKGYSTLVVKGTQYPLQPGTIICIPPNMEHYNIAKSKYTHIFIKTNNFINPFDETTPILKDDEEKSFQTLMFLALRMFYKREANYTSIMGCIYETLYELLLSWKGSAPKQDAIEMYKNQLIANFVDPEYHASNAFEKVPYSIDHFRKLFKKETGMTPTLYLSYLRIEYAKKLLVQENNMTISHIALRSGFYDPQYFSRIFKNIVGMAPQDYISENAKKVQSKFIEKPHYIHNHE